MMLGVAVCFTLYMLSIGTVHSTSIPIFCENMECLEDQICIVVQSAACTPRFCPPPHGECVNISSKPGECPNRLENPKCLEFRGVPMCQIDDDCQDDMKCCGGCCKTPDLAADAPLSFEGLPGMCPGEKDLEAKKLFTGIYCPKTDEVDQCLTDAECPELQKCCTTLCGNRCRRTLAIMAPMPDETA